VAEPLADGVYEHLVTEGVARALQCSAKRGGTGQRALICRA
jgi:hypothetical protein